MVHGEELPPYMPSYQMPYMLRSLCKLALCRCMDVSATDLVADIYGDRDLSGACEK